MVGYYALRKKLWKNVPNLKAAKTVRGRLITVANRIADFDKKKILGIMDMLDDLQDRGKIQTWGLEAVERNLLK